MNLTLRQLRAFSAVAELGSFTEASNRMHVTQAAVSVLVRELESELGVRVLDRHTRRVTLSDAGRDFWPYVQRVLNELEDAVQSVGGLRDKKKGLLRIAAPQLMACTLMPKVIAGYRKKYPDIDVRLADSLPEQTLQQVVTGDVEIAIGPDTGSAPELLRRPILRDHHMLVCRADHPLATKKRARWRDVSEYPFIAPTRDFMRRLAPELVAAGVDVEITPLHEVSYMTTAMGMVAEGLGVTACPSYSASLAKGYRLQMSPLVEPQFFRDVYVFSSAVKSLSTAAMAFVDHLDEFLKFGKVAKLKR